MTKLTVLNRLGHSIWHDNIRRALVDSGELLTLIDRRVTGVASNPSIFEKAIDGSPDYDEAIADMAYPYQSAEAIYEVLTFEDIRQTADLPRAIYDQTQAADGYISPQIDPTLAHDTEGTFSAASCLFAALDRPNAMIKVPANPAGMPAIEMLISEGINLNVTLVFSLAHYENVAEAYLTGLEKLAAQGKDVSRLASAASFFISRVNSAADNRLADLGNTSLQGKIGMANAKAAYGRFHQIFNGERWNALARKGARLQRPPASTARDNRGHRQPRPPGPAWIRCGAF